MLIVGEVEWLLHDFCGAADGVEMCFRCGEKCVAPKEPFFLDTFSPIELGLRTAKEEINRAATEESRGRPSIQSNQSSQLLTANMVTLDGVQGKPHSASSPTLSHKGQARMLPV